jgi:hypothetical protein
MDQWGTFKVQTTLAIVEIILDFLHVYKLSLNILSSLHISIIFLDLTTTFGVLYLPMNIPPLLFYSFSQF